MVRFVLQKRVMPLVKSGLLACLLCWGSNAFARVDWGNPHLPFDTGTEQVRGAIRTSLARNWWSWGLGCLPGTPEWHNNVNKCWVSRPFMGGTVTDNFLSGGEIFLAREEAPSSQHPWFVLVIFPDMVEADQSSPLQLVVDHGPPMAIGWDVCYGKKCKAAFRPEVSNAFVQSLKQAKHAHLTVTLKNGTKWFYNLGFMNFRFMLDNVTRFTETQPECQSCEAPKAAGP
ncbi:hypothetical protein [Bombella saccharophila]|uniref:Uncharacterized protein n=1 Tax=Bombella saccharophila TaxID=2967338 RepID=A0ABT3W834_9PROT|nr:hypothetical protein [Bombella saccharophila]MCX5613798.1 hypothetical protein [Bombella saccharophila]